MYFFFPGSSPPRASQIGGMLLGSWPFVYLDGVYQPICLTERPRIVLDKLGAVGISPADAIRRPLTLGKVVPTEIRVDNNAEGVEVLVHIAPACPLRHVTHWSAPFGRLRTSLEYIPRDGPPRPVPDSDGLVLQESRIDAASGTVERIAVGKGPSGRHPTAIVVGCVCLGVKDLARWPVMIPRLPTGWEMARTIRVDGHDVVLLKVDAFDYINLTYGVFRHVVGPESWPNTALIAGHMGKVGNEETSVVRDLGL